MRGYGRYCGRWLHRSWVSAWTISDFLATLITYIIPVILAPYVTPLIKEKFPGWEEYVSDLAWAFPFAVLLLVGTVRFFIVPYWLDEEQEQEIKKLTQEIESFRQKPDERTIRRKQLDTLIEFIERADRICLIFLSRGDPPALDVESPRMRTAIRWMDEVRTYLQDEFGLSYVRRWENQTGLKAKDPPGPYTTRKEGRVYQKLCRRLIRLRELHQELMNKN